MKQQFFTFLHLYSFKNAKRFFLWFLLLLTFVVMLLLSSFSSPKLSSSSSVLPFSKPITFEPTTIHCKVNNSTLEGFTTSEASFFKMEQAEGIFAKILNMSLEDNEGNLFALSLMDLENVKMDSCLTTNIFYGNEHEDSDKNYSNDIGSSVFSNNSNLIFEKKNGASSISRDGWVKIDKCKYGRISGSFYFKMEDESSTELLEGKFVNVLLEME